MRLVTVHGLEHSKANAAAITAWLESDHLPRLSLPDETAMIRNEQAEGYLTAEDATAILERSRAMKPQEADT